MPDLTDTERDMLAFADLRFKFPGEREEQLRIRFGLTGIEYSQKLTVLLRRPEALAARPVTVNRLRRLAERRREVRVRRDLPARSS